ncbi:sterol sensing 5-transmembrane protein, related [Neospora caninum Liverpool]|uniref:Sterol sensing 5-transmembrane protein, related n=1 Tax=Neospora caninum (strain Liverpool) TaxID=572307 RepID=F0V7K7_NEOCL|nr:sterol sensing 5-transmembrane protein, related [Neospora caninum Liverpool]CBZ49698.1 sterol sensing 5-transmembrane protein, related [Neospora caninum Liverpool]|eukprot:XP_003879733.1 sterol sensing 5-transmembrane protein, related [Neospora caninum Liverpool]
MMVGPPAWSNRAVARAQEEEHEERRRRKEREWEETESFAEERDSDVAFCGSDEDEDCHDDAYYEKLQKDQWSPFECASSFQAAKDRLIHAIGRCFVAYTLVVYKRPWLVIALSLMVSLLLAIGIPLRRVVKDGERQYALPWTRAHNDSLLYSNMFYGNLTRTEVIYVVANVEDTNLLTREFLDALWTFHLEVLELSVSVKPEEELMANTTLPPLLFDQLVGGLGVRDPNRRPHEDDFYWPRRLQTTEANSGDANAADFAASSFLSPIPLQIASQMSSLVLGPALHASASPAKTDLEVSSREKITEASSATVSSVRNVPLSTGREDDHADPVAPRGESEARFISNENKHAALGTLQRGTDNVHQSRQTPVLFRSERNLSVTGDNKVPGVPLQKPAALGATVRALGVTGGFGMSEFGCVETHAPAKDRISGLACRPPLPPDKPHMRPVARAWEAALVKLVENSRWRLPGASIYCKTDQSLEEGLSSSTGFKGSTDILFVLAAGTLIFGYVGLVTFSTNHFRSKMLVSVMGATAAALGYCGGAGLCYLVGLEHTTTATAAPFLVMGIGVDDVFVIINSYSLTFTRTVAKERLTITMRDSGLSITITTLTSIISFAIGATSPYLAIRNFCWITAAGILGGYLMCITFFLACLSIDAYYEERRQQTMARCCLLPVRRPPETGVQRARGGPLETEDAFSGSEGSRKRRPGNGWVGGLQSSGFRFSLPYTEDKKYLATARHSLLNQHASTVYECVTLQVAMEMTKGCELSARRQRPGSDDDSCGRLSDAPARPAREPKRTPKKRVAKAKAKQKAAVKEECDASHLQHPASGSERGASTAAENAPPSLEPATGAGRRGAAKAKAKAKQKGVLRAATPPDASKSIPNATPNLQKQEESKDAHDSSTESAAGRQRRVPPRGARKLVAELQPTKRGKKGGKSISDATANSERGSHTYAEEKTQGNLGHEATCVHPRTPKGAAAEAEMNTKQMSNASLSSSDSSSEDEPPSEVGEGLYRRGENARARAASRAADRGRRCTGFLNPRELSAVAFPRQGGIVRRTNGAKGARNLGQGKKGRTLQTRCPRQKLGAAGPRPRDARPSICRRGSANALPAFRDPRGRDAARNREADEETGTSVPGACGGAHEQPLGLKEQLKKLLDMAEQRQFNPHQTEEEKADAQIAEALGPVLQGKPAATVGPGAVVVLAIEEQLRQNRLETGVEQPRPKAKATLRRKFFDAQEFFFNNYGDPVKIFFTSPRDICSRTFKSEYAWLHQKLESRGYTRHLVDGLHVFLSSPLGAYGPENNPVTCMRILRSWLQTPMGANFASQFAWQGDSELRAFQTLLIPVYFPTSEESSNFMVSLRRDLQSFKAADAHAYNRLFVFYESDTSILSSTLANMAWAGCAVLIVSVLLLPSLWSAIMVIVILVLIDVSIIGFMHFWDLPLNMLTMVNLIISIGFAIDYATHICHTFCHCVGRTRDLRVFETLVLIGNPIFHGVLSTLLGVSVLAFTRSYVLRVFFKMMTLVLVLAFAHGVILLPVLLSLVGPMDPRKEPVKRALKNFVRGLRSKGRTERSK